MHKFKVGQSVSLQSTLFNRDAASGAYKVTKQLPERDGEFEYQVKRPGEPHEREGQIAMQRVIKSYERLIAIGRGQNEKG